MGSEADQPTLEGVSSAARAFIALMRDRSDADKIAVLDALRSRLPGAGFSPGQEVCAAAMRRCLEETGLVSKRAYDNWRQGLEDPQSVPDSSRIHRAFGGWGNARVAIGDEFRLDPTLAQLSARPTVSSERLEQALAIWVARQDGPLRQTAFLRWCSTEEARELVGEGLSTNATTFNSRLGTWRQALAKLGLSPSGAQPPRVRGARHIARRPVDPSTLPQVGAVVRTKDMATWAIWLRELIGQEAFDEMRACDYRQLREELLIEGASAGLVIALPSVGLIAREYGGWHAFKAHAGTPFDPHAAERPSGYRGRPPTKKEACIDALRRAAAELGRNPSRDEYDRWREDSCPSAPRSSTIMRRLCTGRPRWKIARETVLGRS